MRGVGLPCVNLRVILPSLATATLTMKLPLRNIEFLVVAELRPPPREVGGRVLKRSQNRSIGKMPNPPNKTARNSCGLSPCCATGVHWYDLRNVEPAAPPPTP